MLTVPDYLLLVFPALKVCKFKKEVSVWPSRRLSGCEIVIGSRLALSSVLPLVSPVQTLGKLRGGPGALWAELALQGLGIMLLSHLCALPRDTGAQQKLKKEDLKGCIHLQNCFGNCFSKQRYFLKTWFYLVFHLHIIL